MKALEEAGVASLDERLGSLQTQLEKLQGGQGEQRATISEDDEEQKGKGDATPLPKKDAAPDSEELEAPRGLPLQHIIHDRDDGENSEEDEEEEDRSRSIMNEYEVNWAAVTPESLELQEEEEMCFEL